MNKILRIIKRIIVTVIIILLVSILTLIGINLFVKNSTRNQIITVNEANDITNIDGILILGCSVTPEKTPSNMLMNRLDQGIALFNNDVSDIIIMSGDHEGDYYDEVTVMKDYALEQGIPSASIFLDHYGLSTYESLYRAKNIYGVKKLIIVTQEYHLYRALYIANSLGIEAYGVIATDGSDTKGLKYEDRDIREFFARVKDFLNCYIKPVSTYTGESISLNQDGEVTHIKNED